ncbi:lectin [Kitasatospora sp. DSM 101779]|uniref:lectin n=1 Tax=Kitasatospora sp. DSM 101779 TaxID=2853165 RepID=UPI0021D80A3E|nr:lectin [Kitasatospora sp. DSM 101779]MCU7823904.1 lectin [Kitasatospora sp. DSM 101779]
MHRSRFLSSALALGASAVLLAGAAAAPAGAAPPGRVTVTDPAQYVNAFVGTRQGAPDFGNGGGAGNTFPGASAPLGMVQWSPDTATYQHGGYSYDDHRIAGFSLTHISGAGCGDYGTTPFMPVLDGRPAAHADFSHTDESTAPGAYAVTFGNGLKTEIATTQRSGIARFTYPAGHTASLTVDAGKAFNNATGSITIGADTLSGWTESGGFCGTGNRYRVYFHAQFDRPFSSAGIVRTGGADQGTVDTARRSATGASEGIAPQPARTEEDRERRSGEGGDQHPDRERAASGAQALVSFDTGQDRTVTARVGLSFVSADGARANLLAEQRGAAFDEVRTAVRATWNDLLGRIAVDGGTTTQRRILYTALYHALLHPSAISDADGRYPGFDGKIRTARPGHTQYADFSGWDVYRSQVQLLALLDPARAADVAQSVTDQGASAGYLDRWTLANGGTGVMVGDPLPILAASIHAFGGTDFDAAGLLRIATAGSRDTRQRPGHSPYDTIGYIPADAGGIWGSAATTLEYTSADFALAQLADRIGDTTARDALMHRSANWRNLINSGSGWIQPRDTDHSWPDFRPAQQDQFVEGSAAQYTWMVPYNHRGLFDAMGGDTAVAARLDDFFGELNGGPDSEHAYLGNEPSANVPWAYAYAGRPDRTQDVVRRALTTLFADAPDGEPGNDDLGQMSSWVVWAALGMYPQAPGRSELVLASPLFPGITIRRGNGAVIDVDAPGASAAVRYVHTLAVDGAASTRPWLSEDFVRRGGTLAFTLADAPDPAWGSARADAPPSFDVGPARPATGPVTGLGAKCADVQGGSTENGTPVQLSECTGGAAQQWTTASDGTLRALGKCLDVDGSSVFNGAAVQLWDCNGTGAQQWWPRADGSLLNPPSGRCLDLPGSNTASGTRLQLWDCNGTGAQRWTVPA